MGILVTRKKKLRMSAPPRLLDDDDSSSCCTNAFPESERTLTAADARKFLADVKDAGKALPMKQWLQDVTKQRLHPGLITRAEEMLKGHRDLLVAFNKFLPDCRQCTVPE